MHAEFSIGHFGDERLKKRGALLVRRMVMRRTVCLHRLAGSEAEERRFGRWLGHESMSVRRFTKSRFKL
jgi:hypothetical protein